MRYLYCWVPGGADRWEWESSNQPYHVPATDGPWVLFDSYSRVITGAHIPQGSPPLQIPREWLPPDLYQTGLALFERCDAVMQERGAGYEDGQQRLMAQIIGAFNSLTGYHLSERDGHTFMICLKLARMCQRSEPNEDDYVDAINYLRLRRWSER